MFTRFLLTQIHIADRAQDFVSNIKTRA